MQYSLSHRIGAFVGGLDPDAIAYISALKTAGATVTSTQEKAIDDFIKAEKSASRYTLIKRFYLPIWGVAAANAIDMIALGSGTFVGTVTHAAGYVQGDGSTGYFNIGTNPVDLGLSVANGGGAFALISQQDTRTDVRHIIGVNGGSNARVYLQQSTATISGSTLFQTGGLGGGSISRALRSTGILFSYRKSAAHNLTRRSIANGYEDAGETAALNITDPSNTQNIFALANNLSGTAGTHTDARVGAYGITSGMIQTNGDPFTLSLKNLWENATGLTLP